MMKSKNLMGRLIEIAGPYPSLGCERHQAGGKATRRITPILLSLFLAFLVSLAGSVHAAQGGIPGQTTLGSLACTQDQIAKYDGSAWVCAVDESGPLSALACTQDQIAKYNGSNGAWECSDQDTGAVFIKSAGTPIALLVGDASHLVPQTSDPRSWYGLSDVDYLFQVVIDDTPLSDGIVGQMDSSVWFDQDECEGNAYVNVNSALPNRALGQSIVLGLTDATNRRFYLPSNPTERTDVTTESVWETKATQCRDINNTEPVYELPPNNPAVTGVPNTIFSGPITIGR